MKEFLIKTKIVFDRGKYWLGYVTFLMMAFVTVTSMKEYAYFEFLRGGYWLVIVIGAALGGMLLLGYIELKHLKTYQKEIEVLSKINPIQQKVFENHNKILNKLSELESKVDELGKERKIKKK
ncbi:MAG: hypothetical protein A7316_11000 [Candidatus Altiarchaeales archaeon WOR_SM1_86-2]|nr:MAG: hypothetical protein A7316_11000 [Candidatus Altiarchaeales archaeon WOR_SM1_86-2]